MAGAKEEALLPNLVGKIIVRAMFYGTENVIGVVDSGLGFHRKVGPIISDSEKSYLSNTRLSTSAVAPAADVPVTSA